MKLEFDSYDEIELIRYSNENGVLLIADYDREWLDERREDGRYKQKFHINGKCRAIIVGDKHDYWNTVESIDFEKRVIVLSEGVLKYDIDGKKYRDKELKFEYINSKAGRKRKLKGFPYPPKVIPTTFKDFRGAECKVGDNVVFTGKGGFFLREGVIVKITEKKVLLEYKCGEGKTRKATFRTIPECIVKA